jgi:hypothetical protein
VRPVFFFIKPEPGFPVRFTQFPVPCLQFGTVRACIDDLIAPAAVKAEQPVKPQPDFRQRMRLFSFFPVLPNKKNADAFIPRSALK